MMKKAMRSLSAIALLAALAAGCSVDYSASNIVNGVSTGDQTYEAKGFAYCYNCHADAVNPSDLKKVFGDSDASRAAQEAWLSGPHGNNQTWNTTTYQRYDAGADNTGFPYYGYEGLGTTADCTTECHDPMNEGRAIDEFSAENNNDSLGRLERPVILCESCHNTAVHTGSVGTYENPGADVCGQCHNEKFDHNDYHPEGDRIYEDYAASPHAASVNEHVLDDDAEGVVTAKCSKCHTDQGAKKYKDMDGGYTELGTLISSEEPSITSADAVQCRTCHDAHNPDRLLEAAGTDAFGNTTSAQYNTCTNCHQTEDGYHGENSSYSWSEYSVGAGELDSSRIIYDTHFDNAATSDIEGYIFNSADDGVCSDCHNPHNSNNEINNQWAASAHSGHIINTVSQGIANVTEETGPAWVHYDFKDSSSRAACQRCHTATGFMNLADSPDTYDADGNGTPDTANSYIATGSQKELLYCWACHTDNVGGLRDPGLFNGIAPYTNPADRVDAVGDLGGSNICMACHSGRKTGEDVKGSFVSTNNFSSYSPHYMAAGGILFRTIGFEFYNSGDAENYDNPSYFEHDIIGTDAAEGIGGTGGPCVGCHMEGPDGHALHVFERDESTDAVTEIRPNEAVCSGCHEDPYALTLDEMNTLDEGFHAALGAIETQLASKGIYPGSGYPYFFKVSDPASQTTANAFKAWPEVNTLGAAFNYSLLEHLKGAYAHNSHYTKYLIYDSIDWLDNSTLDKSVMNTVGSTSAAWEFLDGIR